MKLFIASFLMLTFTFGASAACFHVSATVFERKPNGETWGAKGGLPDIKACFYDDSGFQCKANKKDNAFCEDSLSCDFGILYFPNTSADVELLDIDINDHDPLLSHRTLDQG